MAFRHQWQPRIPSSFVGQGWTVQSSTAVGTTQIWYDVANFGSAADLKYPRLVEQPGDVWFQQDVAGFGISNAFQYVNATATLAAFQLVTFETPPAQDTVIAANSSTSVVGVTTGTTQSEVGNYVFVENGGTNPQLRVIKANTQGASALWTVALRDPNNTFNVLDADILPYTPTNATKVGLFRPYNRIVSIATQCPCGVALGAVTAVAPFTGTIVQVAGVGLVQASNAVATPTFGNQMAPIAAGKCTSTVAAYAAASAGVVGPYSIMALYAGAAVETQPMNFNFLGVI